MCLRLEPSDFLLNSIPEQLYGKFLISYYILLAIMSKAQLYYYRVCINTLNKEYDFRWVSGVFLSNQNVTVMFSASALRRSSDWQSGAADRESVLPEPPTAQGPNGRCVRTHQPPAAAQLPGGLTAGPHRVRDAERRRRVPVAASQRSLRWDVDKWKPRIVFQV